MEKVLELVAKQIHSLERSLTWPQEAITFTGILINIVKDEAKNSGKNCTAKSKLLCEEMTAKMEDWLDNLKELEDLKKSHSIRIPFEHYTQVCIPIAIAVQPTIN